MRRREVLVLLGGATLLSAIFSPALCTETERPRIGYLSPGSAAVGLSARDEALQGLRELGYVDGENIVVEYRFAEGQFECLSELAAELVDADVDVLVSIVTQASLAAKEATSTIAIVIVAVSDPVTSGIVPNLARPGGNITGTSSMNVDVIGKALELLKEALPAVNSVAAIWNPGNAVFHRQLLQEAELASNSFGIHLRKFAARGVHEFQAAFSSIYAGEPRGALLVLPDPTFILESDAIVKLINTFGIPAIYTNIEYVAVGGLMSYGPNITDQFRRAAGHVDKILKGAKPADLPIEQPREFELSINLKTASPSLLARADEVIE
jgi:putative tryptophan/tyrosine transport system substrate-binding protein